MTYLIGPNTPLRLAKAAVLAFPDGGMTEKGLRREHARGNLTVERVAGKDYTTLAYIEEMRLRCRLVSDTSAACSRSSENLDIFLTNLKARAICAKGRRQQQRP